MKFNKIFFVLSVTILLAFNSCGSNEPNLKELKTYSDYGFEFQYPSNWNVRRKDYRIYIDNPVVFRMGISYELQNSGISHKKRLAELVLDEKGIKTPITRIIFGKTVEGIRVDSDPNDPDVIFRRRLECFVAGSEKFPIVILIEDSIKLWDKEFPGIELILKTLRELDPS